MPPTPSVPAPRPGTAAPPFIREVANLMLDYATTLMAAGAYTSRIVRNVFRIGAAYGYRVDMTIFQKNVTMTVISTADEDIRRTSVKRIPQGSINFDTVSRLSALSWRTFDHPVPFDELQASFGRIVHRERMRPAQVLLLVGTANAAFCRLFGGDWIAMGLVFLATLAGFRLRQLLTARRVNHLATFCLCSFLSSLIAASGVWLHLGSTPQTAIAASVLYLIPGVPIINSVVDLLDGHVLIGISRAVNATFLIICLALGLAATLMILGTRSL